MKDYKKIKDKQYGWRYDISSKTDDIVFNPLAIEMTWWCDKLVYPNILISKWEIYALLLS